MAAKAPKADEEPEPDLCYPSQQIKNRWMIIAKVGSGSFGQVYKVLDLSSQRYYALKAESNNARKRMIIMDVTVCQLMSGKAHAMEFIACGKERNFSYMITQLLGANLLWWKRQSRNRRFTTRTTARIGMQSLEAIRQLHELGFLHRDIKPSNFAVGLENQSSMIYMIDYGLARRYVDDRGALYKPREICGFRGTVRYASMASHNLKELSRADDLCSLMYMLIDLAIGKLPWSDIENHEVIGKMKQTIDAQTLCDGVPTGWQKCYVYITDLKYQTTPDYDQLHKWIYECLTHEIPVEPGEPFDWDWEKPDTAGSSDLSADQSHFEECQYIDDAKICCDWQ